MDFTVERRQLKGLGAVFDPPPSASVILLALTHTPLVALSDPSTETLELVVEYQTRKLALELENCCCRGEGVDGARGVSRGVDNIY